MSAGSVRGAVARAPGSAAGPWPTGPATGQKFPQEGGLAIPPLAAGREGEGVLQGQLEDPQGLLGDGPELRPPWGMDDGSGASQGLLEPSAQVPLQFRHPTRAPPPGAAPGAAGPRSAAADPPPMRRRRWRAGTHRRVPSPPPWHCCGCGPPAHTPGRRTRPEGAPSAESPAPLRWPSGPRPGDGPGAGGGRVRDGPADGPAPGPPCPPGAEVLHPAGHRSDG